MKILPGYEDEGGLINMFLGLGGESIVIFRQDCSSSIDRTTGKYKPVYIKIRSCAVIRSKKYKSTNRDGIEIMGGKLEIKLRDHVYSSDERDGLSADIIFARNKYWKVEAVEDYCQYRKATLNLMPEDLCKGVKSLGI